MIKSILVFLTTFALIYLGIAFITLNFNPCEWAAVLRYFLIIGGLMFSSTLHLYITTQQNEKNNRKR